MRIKLIIEYDGSNYYGFQHQEKLPNIEDTILYAIQKIDINVNKIYGSGRTDRFVHARGQVIHFDTAINVLPNKWAKAINAFLPKDINVKESSLVNDDFHARFSAKRKEYRYYIRYKSYNLFMRNYMDFFSNMDLKKIEEGLKKLVGVHDYRGFCSAQIAPLKDTVKEIYEAYMLVFDEYIEIRFVGNGFLKYQVRKMVGTLVDIAIGRKDLSIIDKIFTTCDPRLSNRVLSGHGLYLQEVTY